MPLLLGPELVEAYWLRAPKAAWSAVRMKRWGTKTVAGGIPDQGNEIGNQLVRDLVARKRRERAERQSTDV